MLKPMHIIRHRKAYVIQRIKPNHWSYWTEQLRHNPMRAWITVPGTNRVRQFSSRANAEYWAEYFSQQEPQYKFQIVEWKL